MERCGTEEEDVSGNTQNKTILVNRCDFVRFVDNKKTHRTPTALSINGVSDDIQ